MKTKKDELSVLFPDRDVEIADGVTVKLKPLSLVDLPKVLDAVDNVMTKASEEGVAPAKVGLAAMREVLALLPFCLVDVEMGDLPGAASAPVLIQAVLEMNFEDDRVSGNWKALVDKVQGLLASAAGQGLKEVLAQK